MAQEGPLPKIKVCYFDLYAKGLQVAMVAAHSGLEWSGKDADFDFQAIKHTVAPFNQLPLLFIEGREEAPIGQSTAIAAVIGRMAGTDGSKESIADFSTSAMLTAETEDLYAAMQKGCPTLFVPLGQDTKTKENHEELWKEVLPRHFGCLEKLLGDSDKFTTTGMTSGELFLFGVVHQIVLCREDVFSETPNLQRWYKRIESLPKTQEVGGPRECFPAFVQYTA